MATGTVAVWSAGRGSGWIRPEGGGDRVYVHKSGIEGAGAGRAPVLTVGERVEYQIGQRAKGSSAINVRPAGTGASVPAASNSAVEDIGGADVGASTDAIETAAGSADEG